MRTSPALWLPVLWVLIAASKPISSWFEITPDMTIDRNLEGNPLERFLYTGLLLIGIMVLIPRGKRAMAFLQMNWPVLLYFSYCAASILWSDYPDVAFKRWIKALADPVMVMIVLTDPAGALPALKRFLARVGFLAVPISILLIKYIPEFGRFYNPYTAVPVIVGIANDKNMLGVICLVLGLGAYWRVLHEYRQRRQKRNRRPLLAQGVLLLMVMWLFLQANSMTSLACFLLAVTLMTVVTIWPIARRRAVVPVLVAGVLAVSSFALFFDAGGGLVKSLGRDPSLTGRTEIWGEVLEMTKNPVVGAGFESFWLGTRLQKIWDRHWWHPNEAHDGYIELYINLGVAGLCLLALIIGFGYRNVLRVLAQDPEWGGLRLAYFTVALTYSFTEAGFRTMNPVWICFLMSTFAVPRLYALQTARVRPRVAEPALVEARLLESQG